MKIYRKNHSENELLYDLLDEAKGHKKVGDNYLDGGEYVTTVYESDSHIYKVVENIDYGFYHSVEKIKKGAENEMVH